MPRSFTLGLSKLKQKVNKMAKTASQKEIDEAADKDSSVPEDKGVQGEQTPETMLINEIERHYDVQLGDDSAEAKGKFIHDCVKESHHRAKELASSTDPIREAQFDEKLGKLRMMWESDLEDKATDEQKQLRSDLKKQYIAVGVSFPDENSYKLSTGGAEATGSMSAGIPAILGEAERLSNPQGY